MKQWIGAFTLSERWLLKSGNWTGLSSGAPALRSYIYQDVGEPTCLSFSTTGMYAGKPLIYTMGNEGHLFTCGNRYVVVKRNWGLRGFHRSECVVFHLVFWMSSFFLCWVGVFVFWGLFSFLAIWRHPAFCISPVLLQPENSWPTTRRFDDRQSFERARHGLKKISNPMTALRRSSSSSIVHRRWLDSGMVLSSLTHSTSENWFVCEFVWLIRSLFWLWW